MSEPSADVSATVEYTMDKWRMDRVPWAMWACVAGLAVALNAESRGQNGAVLAVVYVALLGLAFAGYALTSLIGRSGLPLLLELLIGVLVLIIVSGVIGVISVLVGGPSGRSSYVGAMRSLYWSHLVNPSLNVFGWMMLYLGLGWIAFSAYRHFYADRAVVSMSSAGIHFHRPWLKGLFIPWQEVRGVGHLVVPGISGVPYVSPYAAAVTVGRDFYEQHIASKRSFFAPPGAEAMFQPKGEMMQVVLSSADMAVKPEDFLGPAEVRWKAFGDRAGSSSQPAGTIVYGRWSINGSAWQAVQFLAPLVGLAVVVLYR
ncbi:MULTISPECIES: hypothetical protein [unclassified Bradyrhizobium]|uniref:hypothetical protein n=1 Tax=unclassified Bradyrhizobium TaxID=2631580 RepID=UPI002302479B|nr:hypothetical protein [Bradyrhizobium sp. CCBAU 45321]MDA9543854.1 hypothetical protein [Bradyrhizobium sp. CCBAU 45321]